MLQSVRAACATPLGRQDEKSLPSLWLWLDTFTSAAAKALVGARHTVLAAVSRPLGLTVVPAVQLWLML